MNKITDLITAKRNGKAHSAEDISRIVAGLMDGSIKDYQLTAWLMAAYLKGLDIDETTALTDCMTRSGSVLDLSAIGDVVCDKHSTGGVGDKTTLVLVPLLASAGLPMAKLLRSRARAHRRNPRQVGSHPWLQRQPFASRIRRPGEENRCRHR